MFSGALQQMKYWEKKYVSSAISWLGVIFAKFKEFSFGNEPKKK